MSVEWVTLDTNILVYSIDIDAGFKHERAMEIFWQVRQKNGVLTLQALAEFFVVATRKCAMPIEEAIAQVQDWQTLFPIVTATTTSLNVAMQAVQQHHLSFWDAMLWAVVQQAGVSLLLSEDCQHNRVLEGVRFYNPFLEEKFNLDLI
jgi:predicted nucleic acid-binding protein